MTEQEILEAIAALPEDERRSLLARLREIYLDAPPPAPRQQRLPVSDWAGPVDYLIVFDGGSRGNPGPGYGSYAIFDTAGSGQPVRLAFEGEMTNNEAEYHTLLAAVRDLRKRLGSQAGNVTVKILGDSQLVIAQVSGQWKVKEPRLRALCDQVRAELRPFKGYRLVHQPREDTLRVLGH